MSDGQGGQQVPAGWYPDPAGSGMQRWWDGAGWTDHRQWPQAPAPVPGGAPFDPNQKVAPGTPVYTPWIWILTLLPLVSLALFPWIYAETMSAVQRGVTATTFGSTTRFSVGTGPANVVSQLVGWLIWGLTVLFAWLDHRELRRRGFVRPFHWAFAFIPVPVYPVGRSIVARRRSGRGIAPMWVAIALFALGFIIGILFLVAVFSGVPWAELGAPTRI